MSDNINNEKIDVVEMINSGATVQIMVRGYSMYPLFVPNRDWAVIKKADTSKIKRGDVVLYRRDQGKLVLHRVWKRNKKGFFMVGDNQSIIEGPIREDQLIGILIEVIRNNRKISVNNIFYIIFTRLWLMLRPVRKPISKFIHFIRKSINL